MLIGYRMRDDVATLQRMLRPRQFKGGEEAMRGGVSRPENERRSKVFKIRLGIMTETG